MAQTNNNHIYKCPHCACIFSTRADLQSHIDAFGNSKGQHEYQYNSTHGRLEHGFSSEE
ncbi:MAG: hypothetical protein NWE92_13630 [Candidatus Bathyarchaeota archaeon]|nr:hypothetical protein [Candidatus Bathyarchaeota archaeon]